jgi:3-oxoadipate enol-lactonase
METIFVGPQPRLAVSVEGRGTLVLFLHGIRGHRGHWARQLAAFPSAGYRAAAADARGYGDSQDYEGPLQFDHFTGDVLRVAEHLKAAQFHLVGLSMGGRIARNVALRHPQRLLSLTLVSSTPGFDAMSTDEVARFVTERKKSAPHLMGKLLGSKARPGAFDELLDGLGKLREKSYMKTLEASVAQDRGAPVEQIRTPTLVVAGDEDRVYPPALARQLAGRIPGAELVLMPGVGHLPNIEQPELFDRTVLDFIRRHDKETVS